MLPFGSYITQIPLILFSTIYLLYFGAFALNRIRNKEAVDEKTTSEKKDIRVDNHIENSFNYFDYPCVNNLTAERQTEPPEVYRITEIITVFIPEDPPAIPQRKFNIFSRPPPESLA